MARRYGTPFHTRRHQWEDDGEALNSEDWAAAQELKLKEEVKEALQSNDVYSNDILFDSIEALKSMEIATTEDIAYFGSEDLHYAGIPTEIVHVLMKEFGPPCDSADTESQDKQHLGELKEEPKQNDTWSNEELWGVMAFFRDTGVRETAGFPPDTKAGNIRILEDTSIGNNAANSVSGTEGTRDIITLHESLDLESSEDIERLKPEHLVSREVSTEMENEVIKELGARCCGSETKPETAAEEKPEKEQEITSEGKFKTHPETHLETQAEKEQEEKPEEEFQLHPGADSETELQNKGKLNEEITKVLQAKGGFEGKELRDIINVLRSLGVKVTHHIAFLNPGDLVSRGISLMIVQMLMKEFGQRRNRPATKTEGTPVANSEPDTKPETGPDTQEVEEPDTNRDAETGRNLILEEELKKALEVNSGFSIEKLREIIDVLEILGVKVTKHIKYLKTEDLVSRGISHETASLFMEGFGQRCTRPGTHSEAKPLAEAAPKPEPLTQSSKQTKTEPHAEPDTKPYKIPRELKEQIKKALKANNIDKAEKSRVMHVIGAVGITCTKDIACFEADDFILKGMSPKAASELINHFGQRCTRSRTHSEAKPLAEAAPKTEPLTQSSKQTKTEPHAEPDTKPYKIPRELEQQIEKALKANNIDKAERNQVMDVIEACHITCTKDIACFEADDFILKGMSTKAADELIKHFGSEKSYYDRCCIS